MAEKKSFVIYADWEELVDALDDNEQAGELFKALFAFAKRGERAEFEGALKMAFLMMSQQIARDSEKWEKKSRKNAENYQKRKSENSDRFSNIQHDSAGDTVTDNDTVNDTVTVIDNVLPPARKKPTKHKHGSFGHVMLTDDELSKLRADLGEPTVSEYIRRLDEYIEQKGAKYRNHSLTIRNWAKRDTERGQPKQPAQQPEKSNEELYRVDFSKYR